MSGWPWFLQLAEWAVSGMFAVWPVTVSLLVGATICALLAVRRRQKLPWSRLATQVALLLVPVIALALGAAYACQNCSPSALGQGVRHYAALSVVDGLLLLQLVWAAWFVCSTRGFRILAAFIQASLLWCSYWAACMAGMSISGDWL